MPARAPAIVPFYKCLPKFLAFPLQFEPLLYMALAALAMYPLQALRIFFIRDEIALPFIALALFFLIMAVLRYGFKIMILGAQGVWHSAAWPRDELLESMDWLHLPWKLLVLLALLWGITWLLAPVLGANVARTLVLCLLPAALLALAADNSLREALRPQRLLWVIRLIGPGYMLLCVLLMLVPHGVLLLGTALAGALARVLWGILGHLTWPLWMFMALYAFWAFCSLLGHVMYQHHAALDIHLLEETAPADAPAAQAAALLSPEEKVHQKVEAQIQWLMQHDKLPEALEAARQHQMKQPRNLAAQQRYLELLLRLPAGHSQALRLQGQYVIDLLLQKGDARRALRVWQACRKTLDDFAVNDAAQCLALARVAWQGKRDARLVLAVLKGFDARFAGNGHIPEAWALAVRAHAQGLRDLAAAQRIFSALQQRYPQSPWTDEIRRLLRQLVEQGAEAGAMRAGN